MRRICRSAELVHELQRRGANLVIGRRGGKVGERLDVSAHTRVLGVARVVRVYPLSGPTTIGSVVVDFARDRSTLKRSERRRVNGVERKRRQLKGRRRCDSW